LIFLLGPAKATNKWFTYIPHQFIHEMKILPPKSYCWNRWYGVHTNSSSISRSFIYNGKSRGSYNLRTQFISYVVDRPYGCRPQQRTIDKYISHYYYACSRIETEQQIRSFSSNVTNIQSQQRPKRFYKDVQVIEMDVNTLASALYNPTKSNTIKVSGDSNIIPSFLQPRAPISQLVNKSPTINDHSDNRKATDDSSPADPLPTTIEAAETSVINNQDGTNTKWYTVTLDGKKLRTPLGKPLCIPSMDIAYMIATEWNAVTTNVIPNQMPIMTYTCTVLDQVVNHQESYRQQCLQYLATDTICYYADPVHEKILYHQQKKAWKFIHDWIQRHFVATESTNILPPAIHYCQTSAIIATTTTTTMGIPRAQRIPSTSVVGKKNDDDDDDDALTPSTTTNQDSNSNTNMFVRVLPHSLELRASVQHWVSTLDVWHLLALYVACTEAKSFWLGVAVLIQNSHHHGSATSSSLSSSYNFDASYIQTAARVEEECNIRDWGFVEGQHDYDRLNCSIQLRAISLFVSGLTV
jgi:chaperone required for assembly of F1-ATPase